MALRITSTLEIPAAELDFEFSRGGGPGGQNVNKVETRVEVLFNVANSYVLSDEQKSRLLRTLASRIDSDGNLRVVSQESRSQYKNRELALQKLAEMLRKGLAVPRKRVATKPSKSSAEKRLTRKRTQSEKKRLRGRVSPD